MSKQTQLTINDLVVIQKFLCKTLAEPGSRVTSSDVYESTKNDVESNLELHHFRASLSERIKDGTLAGVATRKGRYGGIVVDDIDLAKETIARLEQSVETGKPVQKIKAEVPTGKEHTGEFAITVSSNYRIAPIDRLNWSLQKRHNNVNGEAGWTNMYYYGTLEQAVHGTAKAILDKRLRTSGEIVITLKDLETMLNNIHKTIVNEMNIEVQKFTE